MQKNVYLRYGLALVTSALTMIPWIVFGKHLAPSPFRFLFIAVLVSALYGGVGSGLLATAIGTAFGACLFFAAAQPSGSAEGTLQIGSFGAVALTIIWLVWRKARAEKQRLELMEAEQEMRAQAHEARVLQAVMRASPLATISVDVRGCVISWNAAAERTFGWSEAEVLDLPLAIVSDEQRVQSRAYICETMKGKALLDIPVVCQRRDGSRIDLALSSAPVYDDHGRPMGAILVYVDRGERTADTRVEWVDESIRQAERQAGSASSNSSVA